ncbi:MAG: hypothetical protein SH856_12350 [Flavobacteriales bacterium]|nr:hypothetical protein [Flavobacteriales bacterium]
MLVFSNVLFSQVLPQTELDYIASLKTQLTLTDAQLHKVDSICAKAFFDTQLINKELQSLARSNTPDEEKNLRTSVNNQKKKDIREIRDLEVRMLLTPEQKLVYDEKIKPEKPAVLHFGMNHDRASCGVCR